MKYRFQLTAVIVAAVVLLSLQIPTNAQMPTSLAMATGMSKTQLNMMESALGQAYNSAIAKAKTTMTQSKLSTSITVSANSRWTCAAGGYINTTMTIGTVVTTKTASANISGSGHQTISSWRCVTGWIVNGDPYISHTISSSTFGGQLRTSAYMSGGWKATGPNKTKQSCQTTSETQYSSIGSSGFTTVHAKCVPGGSTDITTHF